MPPPNRIQQQFNDQQEHYKSLISLFKYSITLALGLFTIVGGLISYFTFANGKEMREAMDKESFEMKAELKEMKLEHKAELSEMKLSLDEQKNELKERQVLAEKNIEFMRIQAEREISGIKTLATTAARARIDEVFKERNLDNLINKIASERIESKVRSMVDEKMLDIEKKKQTEINGAIKDIQSDDFFKVKSGVGLLQANSSVEFTDGQIRDIFDVLKKGKLDSDLSDGLLSVIVYKKENLIGELFRQDLLDDSNNITLVSYYGIQYYSHNESMQPVSFYEKVITNAGNKEHAYNLFIEYSAFFNNKKLLLLLLDSRIIVDSVFPSYDYLVDLRNRTSQKLLPILKSNDFKNSYFFTKPKF